jgi:hypothetical protein
VRTRARKQLHLDDDGYSSFSAQNVRTNQRILIFEIGLKLKNNEPSIFKIVI